MSLEKEFVPYTEAFELKQMGFDKPCFAFWDAYNGGTHLFFERRVQYHWFISIFIKPPPIFECSQGLIEHEEGDNCILAPTYAQAFRFFREKHGLFVQPNARFDSTSTWYYFSIRTKRNDVCEGSFIYEEAELACLRKLIEIVKNKNL